MTLSNLINPVNKLSNNCYASKPSFRGEKSNSSSKDKEYYTYYTGDDAALKKEMMTGAVAFGGLSVLFSYGFSKLFEKYAKKAPPKWLSILEGCALAFGVVGIALDMLIKSRVKNLKPISKEEQIEKEQKINVMVKDLAKQKGVELNGIYFYDFIRTKGDSFALAGFDPSIGCLIINSKFKDTDLDTKELLPLIVHELVHAKQYENIARTKDGLYDFNRITVITEAKKLTEEDKKELLSADDEKLRILANKRIHNLKDFILINEEQDLKNETKLLKAIKIYLNNPDISKYDLPMTFNENYYDRITKGKGQLSQEEIKKVQSYLEYMEKSISVKAKKGEIGKSRETTSNYFNDPMEKEAYEAQSEYIKTGKIT